MDTEKFGDTFPSGTQWSLIKDLSAKIDPVYQKLLEIAAQGEIFYHDDTNIKVLSLIKENKELDERKKKELKNITLKDKEPKKDRKGMFTTGILSVVENNQIALYYTGRNHAGENLAELFKKRMMSLPPPIQMCDAAPRNEIKEDDKKEDNEPQTHLANCLAHARRKFVDLLETFPDESEHVIKQLAEVYCFEKDTRIDKMTPKQRLEYHIENSKPIMDELKIWFEKKFEQKQVEENSSLGKAIKYMLNHWVKLTLFLKIERTPLDNNPCERSLKVAIRNRKNSLFYKTLIGAETGDKFMSIIQTCKLGGVNIFNYLTDIQKYQNEVIGNTEAWLPWNYKKRFQDLR
jgi:transposase